ncbi:MAG: signal peptide peptidase SppA [Pseudomonadota bacterium]|nr:signal peptide peptidase SppA [Pseudomonadota bacterium]
MSFFKLIWRFISGVMRALQVLIFFGILFIFIIIFRQSSDVSFNIADSTALIINPTGVLTDQLEGEPLDIALLNFQSNAGSQTLVRDVIKSLELAAQDDRIRLVVLFPQMLQSAGLTKLQMIGDAIDKFQESGKPVIAMADSYTQPQYYLASRADEVYMHDFGLVSLEGFGYYKTYFAEAIQKLRVDVNVFRVGEYKSFVEPYLRNDMSSEDKDSADRWLNGLWAAYQLDVTNARSLDSNSISYYIDNLTELLKLNDGDTAKVALSQGFLDGLMNHQQFRDYIIEKVGPDEKYPDDFQSINFRSYLAAQSINEESKSIQSKNVGVLVASGSIVDGEAAPGSIGSASLSRLIREAANDETISAVVLQIDSPGGSMFASEVVHDQLQILREKGKPLIASMSSVAASGGYYISLPADEIWASDASISGSIGVGAIFPTFQRSLNALGVNIDGFGTSDLSGQFSGLQELNEKSKELLNISVSSAYDTFIAKVAEARGMEISEVDQIARGRVWIGSDALQIGLIDYIGSIDKAIISAAALADLPEGKYGIKYIERQLSFSEKILLQYSRLLSQFIAPNNLMNNSIIFQRLIEIMKEPMDMLKIWSDPRGMFFYCFCEVS